MSLFYDNTTSSSATLFNDTLQDTPLQGHDSPPPLVFNMTNLPCGIRCEHSGGSLPFIAYLFFASPWIGLVVLLAGSCVLHTRRATPDAVAIARRRERIDEAREKETTREERRRRLVEGALITTKATTLAKRKSTSAMPLGARGRSSTTETDFTAECPGDDADGSDSAASSSCGYPAGARRASEESSHATMSGEEGDRNEKGPDEAERGEGPATPSVVSNASESLPGARHALDQFDWRTETCAICLEPYEENDDVSYSRHMNCRHAFHTQCIYSWLIQDETRDDCPYCREPYLHISDGGNRGELTVDVVEAIDSTGAAVVADLPAAGVVGSTSDDAPTAVVAAVEEGDFSL